MKHLIAISILVVLVGCNNADISWTAQAQDAPQATTTASVISSPAVAPPAVVAAPSDPAFSPDAPIIYGGILAITATRPQAQTNNCTQQNLATGYATRDDRIGSAHPIQYKGGFDFDTALPDAGIAADFYFTQTEDTNGISQITLNAPHGIKVVQQSFDSINGADDSGMVTSLTWYDGGIYGSKISLNGDFTAGSWLLSLVNGTTDQDLATTLIVKTASGKLAKVAVTQADWNSISEICTGYVPGDSTQSQYLGAAGLPFQYVLSE